MILDLSWANPVVTRSKVVLEIASALVESSSQPQRKAKVYLHDTTNEASPICLFGSSTFEGVHEVVAGLSHLAIINPASALTLAYRGAHPFDAPQPVRTIGVIPSADELIFAVRPQTGLERFEDIVAQKYPLRVSTRGLREHCIHTVLDHVYRAAGFSVQDLDSWGGAVRPEGGLPSPTSPKFRALVAGDIDAIFDEGSDEWVAEALDAGMRILPLGPSTLHKLKAVGFRESRLSQSRFPGLPSDIPTVDFSGWPIFVRADLDDGIVRRICAALDARKHLIPWQGSGPLPVARMTSNSPDTPLDVPLHAAAERFWRDQGYV